MRIQIDTNGPIKDKDLRAMFIIQYAFELCDKRMIEPTLQFFADTFGYRLVKK